MRAGLDAYLDHVSRHARPFVALMRGGIGSDPEVVGVLESVRATYVDRFLENADGTPLAGILLSNRPLVRIAIRGWIGFVEAASLEWLQRKDVERTELRDLLVDALLATLRRRSALPPPAPLHLGLDGSWSTPAAARGRAGACQRELDRLLDDREHAPRERPGQRIRAARRRRRSPRRGTGDATPHGDPAMLRRPDHGETDERTQPDLDRCDPRAGATSASRGTQARARVGRRAAPGG
jgi:hypothetical protein